MYPVYIYILDQCNGMDSIFPLGSRQMLLISGYP